MQPHESPSDIKPHWAIQCSWARPTKAIVSFARGVSSNGARSMTANTAVSNRPVRPRNPAKPTGPSSLLIRFIPGVYVKGEVQAEVGHVEKQRRRERVSSAAGEEPPDEKLGAPIGIAFQLTKEFPVCA